MANALTAPAQAESSSDSSSAANLRADALPPWLSQQLGELLQRRGHALLLQGPSGLGQYPLALALAAAWLCERPGPAACGTCASCHAIAVRTHPDLAVLMPETTQLALGWPLDEKSQAEIDDKKRKASGEIRIAAMREVIEFAQRTDSRGRGKVVLVHPADQMNAATANALLKTLEEPPGAVRFVLATDAAHRLLPTVRSRCQTWPLRWPAREQAEAWLATQGVAAGQGAIALRLAGGRPHDALALAHSGIDLDALAKLPQALWRGDESLLAALEPVRAIALLQQVCHDVLAKASGAAPRYFQPSDLPALRNPAPLAQWWTRLAEAARHAEHPFKPDLMVQALVTDARRTLHSAR